MRKFVGLVFGIVALLSSFSAVSQVAKTAISSTQLIQPNTYTAIWFDVDLICIPDLVSAPSGSPGIDKAAKVFAHAGELRPGRLAPTLAAAVASDVCASPEPIHSLASPTRFYAKSRGIYVVSGQVVYEPIDGGTYRDLIVAKNGDLVTPLVIGASSGSNYFGSWRTVQVNGIVKLEAGEYVEFFAYQDSPVYIGITGTWGTWGSMYKLCSVN